MNGGPAQVFALPVGVRWLVYSPLHGAACLMNGEALEQLRRGEPRHAALRRFHEMLDQPVIEPSPRTGPARPIFLGLIGSRQCNLDCVYCNFGAGRSAPKERMDPALAVEAVDWTARHALDTGADTLAMHFFGGEPFIEWDLVEIVTHRARYQASKHGLKIHLEASSNGVLPEERAIFAGEYFQSIVLSFDGFANLHDRNRPHADGRGSFEEVARTARILSESPAELCLRICVTGENTPALPDIVRWFAHAFRPAYIDFETITETELGTAAGLAAPDPIEFARVFRECRSIASGLGVEANYSADLQHNPRTTFCPVGQDALILTPDGRLSSCYLLEPDWRKRGLDMVLGTIESGRGVRLDAVAVERARNLALPGRCHRCFARWSCAGGCRVNHSYPGCEDVLDGFCAQTRLIVACSILDRSGQEAVADGLVADRESAARLAFQPSDVLAREAVLA